MGEMEGARGSWGRGSGSLSLMVALNVAVRSTGLGSLPCRARPMEGKANGSRLVGGTDSPTAEAAGLSELLPVYKGSSLRHTAIGLPMICSHPGPTPEEPCLGSVPVAASCHVYYKTR